MGGEKGRKKQNKKVIVAGMDGHTSKAVEEAKVMWEWREQGWMVHQGHLSEHDCAGPASVYLQPVFARGARQVKSCESQR